MIEVYNSNRINIEKAVPKIPENAQKKKIKNPDNSFKYSGITKKIKHYSLRESNPCIYRKRVMSVITSLMFLGGWGIPFFTDQIPYLIHPLILGIKTLFIMSFFVIIRTTLPRYKYDLLMNLGWKTFLPLSLSWFLSTIFILLFFDGLPAFGGFNFKFCYFDVNTLFLEDFINAEINLNIPEICIQKNYLQKRSIYEI